MDNTTTYVTLEQGKSLNFGYDYKQVFHHNSSLYKTSAEYVIVKDYCYTKNEEEKKIGLEILMFLRDFCFASQEQLETILKQKKLNTSYLPNILEKYTNSRIINFFILNRFDTGEIPNNAFYIYCLDHGGKFILSHFSPSDYISWMSSDNIRSTELIIKYLMTNFFYLNLHETKKENLKYFKPLFYVNIGKREICFSAAFQLMQKFTARDFIIETVRNYDLPTLFQKKVDQQFAPFILNNHWKKYYFILPVFIFLSENKEQALEISDIFYKRTKFEQFRVLLDEDLKNGFNNAVFYKYIPESEKEPLSKLITVKAPIFSSD